MLAHLPADIELFGCLRSDGPSGVTREPVPLPGSTAFGFVETAEAVACLLDNMHTESMVLVGYSLGARLALYLAQHFGHNVETVVSISGSTGMPGKPEDPSCSSACKLCTHV